MVSHVGDAVIVRYNFGKKRDAINLFEALYPWRFFFPHILKFANAYGIVFGFSFTYRLLACFQSSSQRRRVSQKYNICAFKW